MKHHYFAELTVLLALLSSAAYAQLTPLGEVPQGQNVRRFPEVAKRADFVVKLSPEVLIDGQLQRMAPGGRIFNEQNFVVMPASLTGQKYVVNYTKDFLGQVKDVWILSREELKLKSPHVLKQESDKRLQQQILQTNN
jgi:hypothetical protein